MKNNWELRMQLLGVSGYTVKGWLLVPFTTNRVGKLPFLSAVSYFIVKYLIIIIITY